MIRRSRIRLLLPLAGLLLAAAWSLFAAPAHAQTAAGDKALVAVLDVRPVHASPEEAHALTERLRAEVAKSGRFTLLEAKRMAALQSQGDDAQSGCETQECAVELGRRLGVHKVVAGNVVKVSDQLWLLSAMLVDVETGELLTAASVRHSGTFAALLDSGAPELSQRLAADSAGDSRQSVARTPGTPDAKASLAQGFRAPLGEGVRIAVFAPLYSGNSVSVMISRDRRIQAEIFNAVKKAIPTADFVYLHASGEAPSGADAKEIAKRSWSGLFVKSPASDFIIRKGREMGVEYVLLLQADPTYRYGETMASPTVHLFDVVSGNHTEETLEEAGVPALPAPIAAAARKLLSEAVRGRPAVAR